MTLLILLGIFLPQDSTDRLIEQLSSGQPEARETAQAELVKRGEAARDALVRGAKSADSEVRSRCAQLVEVLDRRRRAAALEAEFSPALRRESPDLAARLLVEDEATWILLLEQLTGWNGSGGFLSPSRESLGEQKRVFAATTRSDLLAILSAYDRGPWRSTEVEAFLYGLAVVCDLDLPPPLRVQMQELENAGHPIPGILRSLQMGCGTVATAFDRIDRETEPDAYARYCKTDSTDPQVRREALVSFLGDSRPERRAEAVHRLRVFGVPEVDKELLRALEDSNWAVVSEAVEAAAARGLREAVDTLHRRLKDGKGDLEFALLEGLIRFRDPKSHPTFEARLRDENEWARELAVRGIAITGDAESGKVLLPLLKDPSAVVRPRVVEALARLKTAGAAEAIRPMADDLAARAQALRALGRLHDAASREILRVRLDDLYGDVRREAALALAQLGETDSLPRVVEEAAAILRTRSYDDEPAAGESMSPERFFVELNRLAFPAATDRLLETQLRREDYEGTWPKLLSVWGKQSGWTLTMAELPEKLGHFSTNDSRSRNVPLVERMLWVASSKPSALLIDGEKSVRIVTLETAEAHWKAWKPAR